MAHIPVLKKEVLEYLDPKPNENFVDATLGEAGHSLAILEKTKPDGKILGIDWGAEMIERLEPRIKDYKLGDRIILIRDCFVNLKKIVEENNFKSINGILFDLGYSSWHIDESGKGLTFQKDEPLDMRLGSGQLVTAEEVINNWKGEDIERILKEYGDERFSKRIAMKIVETRKVKLIKTTFELIEVIRRAFPKTYKFGKSHFATRTFQAIRIAVNNELENLKIVLPQAIDVLESGGRVAVISFHSGEDRIVKNLFREKAKQGLVKILTKKPIQSSFEEIKENPRARTAKLRVAIKI